MEMSIEKQIRSLEYLKISGVFPYTDTRTGIIVADDYVDSIVETMHKYQKIADIIDNRYGKPVFKTLDEIIKVVEDEKID